MPILAILFTRQGGRPTKHKRVISWDAMGLVPGIQGGRISGCKVMVLQANWVGSWRWPCSFAYHYYLDFDVVWFMLCWF